MPLEIRELVIKTTVNSDRPINTLERGNQNSIPWSEASQSAIVAACVEQVLSILQSESER